MSYFFRPELELGKWSWWYAPIIVLLAPFSQMLLGQFGMIAVALFIPVFLSLVHLRGVWRADFGLIHNGTHHVIKISLWALFGFVAFTALVYAVETYSATVSQASHEVIRSLQPGESIGHDLSIVLGVCVLAPLAEELIFRGVVFRSIWNSLLRSQWIGNTLSTKTHKWLAFAVAALVSATAFNSIHGGGGQDHQLILLFVLALMACGLYAITGSIIAPIMLHALNNAYALWNMLSDAHATLSQPFLYGLIAVAPLICLLVIVCWGYVIRFLEQN